MIENFDQILAKDDLQTRVVAVPEWGDEVTIKALSAKDFSDWVTKTRSNSDDKSLSDEDRNVLAMINMVGLSIINPKTGERIGRQRAMELREKSQTALLRVYNACSKLNGMSPNEVKELEKN